MKRRTARLPTGPSLTTRVELKPSLSISSDVDKMLRSGSHPLRVAAETHSEVAAVFDDNSLGLLRDLHGRFDDVTYQGIPRDRADMELIQTTALFRIGEALEEINARQRLKNRGW